MRTNQNIECQGNYYCDNKTSTEVESNAGQMFSFLKRGENRHHQREAKVTSIFLCGNI